MAVKRKTVQLYDALGITFALMAFAWFIPYSFPWQVIAFAALIAAAFLMGRNIKTLSAVKKIIGPDISSIRAAGFAVFGTAGGLVLALFYRNYLDIRLFPDSFQSFALIAVLVGGMEELVYRGLIQNLVKPATGVFSILFSSLSHTGYKCFLFLSPVITETVDLSFLFCWTFGIGLVFGTFRHFSKSIWIPLSAHMTFDIMVYGELAQAPWWVW